MRSRSLVHSTMPEALPGSTFTRPSRIPAVSQVSLRSALSHATGTSLLALILAMGSAGCELAVQHDAVARTEEWTRTYTSDEAASLSVKTGNGDITLTGSDRSDVRVVATKRARGLSAETTQGLLASTSISETRDGNTVRLEVDAPRALGLLGHGGVEVDFSIEVPRATSLTLQTANGRIRADTIDGKLGITTVNGAIDGTRLGGALTASAVNGRIALDVASISEGGVQAKTVNGAVGITLPLGSAATIDANCVNCSVRTEGLEVTPASNQPTDPEARRGARRSLQGTLNGGGPDVRVSTVNGSIRFVAGAPEPDTGASAAQLREGAAP